MITTKTRYALEALIRLAKAGRVTKVYTLAAEANLPPMYLEQIFGRLRKAGLVKSIRGPGGGFVIVGTDFTALDVYNAVETSEGQGTLTSLAGRVVHDAEKALLNQLRRWPFTALKDAV